MTDELEKNLEIFNVRDALILHDRRLNQLSDLSHETQGVVKRFEEQMVVLLERINKGVSPTMQQIKDQNSDLKNQITEFKGDVNTRFKDIEGRIDLQAEHFEQKLDVVSEWRGDVKKFIWTVAGALLVSSVIGLFGFYVYVHSTLAKQDQLESVIKTLLSKKK